MKTVNFYGVGENYNPEVGFVPRKDFIFFSPSFQYKFIPKNNNFKQTSQNLENAPQPEKKTRRSKFKSLLLDKNFEPENPKSLEELHDEICRWPIGHPNEPDFYFCGRKSMKDFSYCKLHVLYAFQPKNKKEDLIEKDDGVPQFIEKKIKSA